eukprot:TRINITY_DN12758_c0_g1_i1.p1 TRINITY_DN12758_c0_g1~~TRINITY_DN12758_c0_g1_i1.p1  ORF type:complete len:265 (+),score=35.41 TRINITY_DN12758_c0_g1_i1:159-953(+)
MAELEEGLVYEDPLELFSQDKPYLQKDREPAREDTEEEKALKQKQFKIVRVLVFLWMSIRNYVVRLFPGPRKLNYKLEYLPHKYFKKMIGQKGWYGGPEVPLPGWVIMWSFIGAFLGILAVSILNKYALDMNDYQFLVGSYGASAVLLYAAPTSPLAQPRNTIGGHTVASIVGVTCFKISDNEDYVLFSSCLAVAFAIVAMHFTGTLHPPAAATALIGVVGSDKVHGQGYLFVPFMSLGSTVMTLVAVIVNNIPQCQHYPQYWW